MGAMDARYVAVRKLYRDVDNRWLAGVMAGLAAYFGWNLTALRIVAMAACLSPIVPLVVIVYCFMALFIPPRSLRQLEAERWGPPTAPPYAPYAPPAPMASREELAYRLREMEDRLRAMEAYMTSTQYEIDRELKRR
jgi:phage shock protein C